MNERSSPPDRTATALDPELLALPSPPRGARGVAVALLAVTAVCAVILAGGLTNDVRYAFAGSVPEPIGELAAFAPEQSRGNSFVTARAKLDDRRALTYRRTTEAERFQLAPVATNDRLWIEMRLPPASLRAEAPPVFVGRLVPMHSAAFRYRGLGRSVDAGSPVMPLDAWVLIDGATPASYRWTIALAALLVLFAAYSVATIGRLLRRVG